MTQEEDGVLLRRVRVVPVGGPVTAGEPGTAGEPVDVRVADGVVTEVGALDARPGERALDGDGRWLVPGLWDAHVHFTQWARNRGRLDLGATRSAGDVTAALRAHLAALGPGSREAVVGYGYRSGSWPSPPTVAELDAVAGDRPVVLVSGDAHNGWLSTAALRALGVPERTGALEEGPWFEVFARLSELPGTPDDRELLRAAAGEAAARGVVGISDMELELGFAAWPSRVAGGVDQLRVRTAVYPDGLDAALAAGLRTGDVLDGTRGLVTMGPLKVIFDGSVNTRTAWCCEPYAGTAGQQGWRGLLNHTPEALTAMCARARAGGLEVAVHAIGDAAVSAALDSVERSGATGSVEHVQLLDLADARRFATLGVTASVQPAHLLDDRDVTAAMWPDRHERCFALRSLADAGARLALGSDAPVAPLDPWLAMAVAVHRSADERPAWSPEQALTPAQALAASTGGWGTVRPGSPADLALLEGDPLAPTGSAAEAAARLRGMRVAATLVGGRLTAGG